MIFGSFEILLCLAPMMLIFLTIAVGLAAQNVSVDRSEKNRGLVACPHCQKMLNPEAYICRFCTKELYDHSHS
ncbi:hypothetical protein BH10ACI3_BH10ACI3_11740 [soil metagenome]